MAVSMSVIRLVCQSTDQFQEPNIGHFAHIGTLCVQLLGLLLTEFPGRLTGRPTVWRRRGGKGATKGVESLARENNQNTVANCTLPGHTLHSLAEPMFYRFLTVTLEGKNGK